jgi:alpha-tubulin suppressor-like RCC1 family protein
MLTWDGEEQGINKLVHELQKTEAVRKPRILRLVYDNPGANMVEEKVVHIACGREHVIVTTSTGNCFVWGNNEYGQLGLFSDQHKVDKPTRVTFFNDRKLKMAAAGANHSLYLSEIG